jgi:RimJ/RimL family protein N-acetyltransferase
MERWWQAIGRDRTRLGVAIVNDEGRLIGDIELENVAWRAGEAELRIAIGDKTYWNRGYGTQALQEMAQVAFELLRLRSLYLRVADQNIRAIRSYRKAGFRKVGRLSATGRLCGGQSLVLMRMTPETAVYGVRESAVSAGLALTAR